MKKLFLVLLAFSANLSADYYGNPNANKQRQYDYNNSDDNQYGSASHRPGMDSTSYNEHDPVTDRSRLNDWDYQQGWRYSRDAYLKGETQPQYYEETHPNGRGGIGYDHPR
jgi:hypothetical protein